MGSLDFGRRRRDFGRGRRQQGDQGPAQSLPQVREGLARALVKGAGSKEAARRFDLRFGQIKGRSR